MQVTRIKVIGVCLLALASSAHAQSQAAPDRSPGWQPKTGSEILTGIPDAQFAHLLNGGVVDIRVGKIEPNPEEDLFYGTDSHGHPTMVPTLYQGCSFWGLAPDGKTHIYAGAHGMLFSAVNQPYTYAGQLYDLSPSSRNGWLAVTVGDATSPRDYIWHIANGQYVLARKIPTPSWEFSPPTPQWHVTDPWEGSPYTE
jgi:hypothetical protein